MVVKVRFKTVKLNTVATKRGGLRFAVGNAGVVVVTAWWLIGLAISARNGLGLRFAVGNAGGGGGLGWWACDLGVVVA
uniref:Transmembrane protein n=1 Tax=Fagus sylvatica TaxID=28930 RepID=A0A2N9GCX6_FAGSY